MSLSLGVARLHEVPEGDSNFRIRDAGVPKGRNRFRQCRDDPRIQIDRAVGLGLWVNEGPAIALGLNDRVTLQQAVGLGDRLVVQVQVVRKLSDRRQGIRRARPS